MHNEDNVKLRIFSFILKRQPKQLNNFITDVIGTFMYSKDKGDNTNSGVFALKLHKKLITQTTKLCN